MRYKSITEVPTSELLYEIVRRSNTYVVPVSSSQAFRIQVADLGDKYKTEKVGLGSCRVVVLKD